MTVTPERTAELLALLEQVLGFTPRPPPKPKVVVNEAVVELMSRWDRMTRTTLGVMKA
jgi:hypothetical protein